MDDELRAAVEEVRVWTERQGGSLVHMTDAAVLEGIEEAATTMPASTAQIAAEHELTYFGAHPVAVRPVERVGAVSGYWRPQLGQLRIDSIASRNVRVASCLRETRRLSTPTR
jgi:hypothetical protein